MASTATAEPIDTAAFLSDLAGIESTRNGQTCSAGTALDQLPPEVRGEFLAVLDSERVSTTKLCDVLARHGLHVRAPNLARHRRRGQTNGCRCPRESE